MPHIESTTKSHAPKVSYTPSSPQPKAVDSARGTFESMLDDHANDAKAATKDANPSAADARSQTTPAPKAKSDNKTVDASKSADEPAAKTATPDQTQAQAAGKPVDPIVVAAETDAIAATVGIGATTEIKSDSDKPATDAAAADAANALPVVPTVPTVPTVPAMPVATVATLTPADAAPAQPQAVEEIAAAAPAAGAMAVQQTVQTEEFAPVVPGEPHKAAAKDSKDQPLKADQAGDEETAAQPEQQAATESDKPKAAHAAPSKTDLEHIARARGETPDKTDATSGRAQNEATEAAVTTQKADVPTHPMHATQSTHQTQNVAATPAPTQPQATAQAAAVPLAGVAVAIANKAVAGAREFEIRLDPPELGRIEVRMHVDRDGNVTSRLIADRQDTLDLLKRDSSHLERALQDAGLKTSDNGMQFSLRDQSLAQDQQQSGGNGKSNTLFVQDETLPVVDVPVQNYGRLAGRPGGLDIRV